MYGSFYNLVEKPFSISTDPRFLWCGEKHNEALANLKYGVMERNGFVVLTGDIGTGKTTLVNALLAMLSDNVIVAKINHPSLETVEFLTLVAKTFDPTAVVPGKSDLLLFFNAFLKQVYREGNVALLIVDEAHRLSIELLEEIRLLSNIEQDGMRMLNIIFVGQDELKPMLSSPQCRALRQRITLFYDIQVLSEEETAKYVGHRLKVSGLHEQLFTPSAIQKIHAVTHGNPRLINILCDRALLTGYVKARRIIDADIIIECAREITPNYKIKSIVLGDAGSTITTWGQKILNALATRSRTVVQWLGPSPEQLDKEGKETAKLWRLRTGALTEKVLAAALSLAKKYRRKVIPIILVAGMVSLSFALTVGALKVAGNNDAQSRQESLAGPVSPPSVPPIEDEAQREEITPAAKAETVGIQSASRASAPEFNASDPMPLPEHEAVAPSITPEKPDPVELAAAALEQKEYQKALALLEADRSSPREENSNTSGLYAKALVGRAGEIIADAPLEAESMLLKAVEIAPDTAQAFLMLGKRYTQIKDYPRAMDAYQKAVHLDPLLPDAFFNLGFISATLGKYGDAEQAFAKAVKLEPPYLGKSLFNLAVVQQKLGKKAESLANLEEAVAVDPENEKALAYLGRLKGVGRKYMPRQTK